MTDFRKLIEARIAELQDIAEFSHESTATVELDQTRQGRLSRMDALQGQAMAQAGEQRRKLTLQRLEGALKRIEQGNFGECAECAEPIAEARLKADPATTLCLACATAKESQTK